MSDALLLIPLKFQCKRLGGTSQLYNSTIFTESIAESNVLNRGFRLCQRFVNRELRVATAGQTSGGIQSIKCFLTER
jgi:hypothetical protein